MDGKERSWILTILSSFWWKQMMICLYGRPSKKRTLKKSCNDLNSKREAAQIRAAFLMELRYVVLQMLHKNAKY